MLSRGRWDHQGLYHRPMLTSLFLCPIGLAIPVHMAKSYRRTQDYSRLDYESPLELVRRLIKDSLYFPCLLILRDYEETKENAVLYTVGFLHMA